MEYRLGTDNRIKARGETVELTCPQCGKKGHFGVFSNFERRIAVKLPLPLECQTVYFLVCSQLRRRLWCRRAKGR